MHGIKDLQRRLSFVLDIKEVLICIMTTILSRVLRDSTPRYVGQSVGRSVGRLVGPSIGRSVGPSQKNTKK